MSALNRVSLSLKKPSLKPGKHKKLNENWFDIREPVKDGMKFNVKYIGLTKVDQATGEKMSSDAVQRIFNLEKISLKKLRKVQLTISPSGIKIHDQAEIILIDDISVYRISFCTVAKQHSKVFAFVAQNSRSETMECYAYLCNTRKEARSLTVTVAQSFKLALEMFEDETKSDGAETKTPPVVDVATDFQEKSERRTIPGIPEKKYQRFSSSTSFEQGNEKSIHKDGQKELSFNEFDFLQTISQEETKNEDSEDVFSDLFQLKQTPQTTQVIVPLRPPPSVSRPTDKPSPRRSQISFSETLLEVALSPTPKAGLVNESTVEDLDQGFADLALSRTQGTPNSNTNNSQLAYPPSNPFSNPSNPFYT